MVNLASLARNPVFACYFECVHPLFWAILYWQLKRAALRLSEGGYTNALIRIRWWGGVEILYPGARREDPSAYKPVPRQRPHWSDPAWASDMPAVFTADAALGLFAAFEIAEATPRRPRLSAVIVQAPAADTS